MTPLNKLIREHYGSQKQLAAKLNVAEHTVMRWVKREPTSLMKHAHELTCEMPQRKQNEFVVALFHAVSKQMDLIGQN